MAKGWRTKTDHAMNARVAEHEARWFKEIKPYYDSLVNDHTKKYRLPDAGQYEVWIHCRQLSTVECTGKTNFWKGTLRKEDYRVTGTTYLIHAFTKDKETGEETTLYAEHFEDDPDAANRFFLDIKGYLS